jgi:hypothetical protein
VLLRTCIPPTPRCSHTRGSDIIATCVGHLAEHLAAAWQSDQRHHLSHAVAVVELAGSVDAEHIEAAVVHMHAKGLIGVAAGHWYRRLAGLGCTASRPWSCRPAAEAQLAASGSSGTD